MGIVLTPLVVLLPPAIALASATGWELINYYGAATVYAEPLPTGTAGRVEVVDPEKIRKPGQLRHSLHTYDHIRKRVAEWIQECIDTSS